MKRGFTIIELLVVISVLAILSTIGFVAFNTYQKTANDGKRKADIAVIQSALDKYFNENGEFPGGYWSPDEAGNSEVINFTKVYLKNISIADPNDNDAVNTKSRYAWAADKTPFCATEPDISDASYCRGYFYEAHDSFSGSTSGGGAYGPGCGFEMQDTTSDGWAGSPSATWYILGYYSETDNSIHYSGKSRGPGKLRIYKNADSTLYPNQKCKFE